VGKSQAKNMKDEERITGTYYQYVSTVLFNKRETVLSEVRTIIVQYLCPLVL
jgi:hypothetical protein